MSAFGERPGMEGQVAYARRRKSGLEVPLKGRFYGEAKYLVFSPPLWHSALVIVCIVGGALATLLNLLGIDVPGGLFTTIAVLAAGMWGAFSNELMVCNLRNRTYARYEGFGPGKRTIRGNLAELDAVVLTSEQYGAGIGIAANVIYRLVIFWKGMRHPPLIAERESRSIPFGAPLNYAAGRMLHEGMRYAQALQVPYYDNSHMAGHSPVPII